MSTDFDTVRKEIDELRSALRDVSAETTKLSTAVSAARDSETKVPATALDLWLKFRNSAEQRHYWFLLAQATVAGPVLSNLDDLGKYRLLGVCAILALAVGSTMAAIASTVAYVWETATGRLHRPPRSSRNRSFRARADGTGGGTCETRGRARLSRWIGVSQRYSLLSRFLYSNSDSRSDSR